MTYNQSYATEDKFEGKEFIALFSSPFIALVLTMLVMGNQIGFLFILLFFSFDLVATSTVLVIFNW